MKIDLWQKQRTDILWCFVIFAFGIGCYFGLPWEPNFLFLLPISIFWIGLAILKKHFLYYLIFSFWLGFTVATGRTFFVHTTLLQEHLADQTITGQVIQTYNTHTGQTVLLGNLTSDNTTQKLDTIRLTLKKKELTVKTGDTLTFRGDLNPPKTNQQLRFFYQGISAQAKINQLIKHDAGTASFFDELRTTIIERLQTHLPSSEAQIAIPLVTGEQQVVSSSLYNLYRKAGIAHILSVSGFHMALLAGFVFLLVRCLFQLFAKKCPAHMSRKIAAIMAFFITGFYLFLSGHQVPALRSFMMITLVLFGILIDRKTISLYNLLLVGFVILFIHPEWITSISFQLSFTAVMVLVGLFEDITHHIPHPRFLQIFLGAITANIVITLALAPFVAYHFHVFNPYGILGNLLTSLLFSLWVMPLLFSGVLLMPFHCEAPFIKSAGYGLNLITHISKKIADLPLAQIPVPSLSVWGLALIAFGLVFLCLVKTRKRSIGFLFITAGLFVGFIFQPKPDIFITNNGQTVLVRENNLLKIKGKRCGWKVHQYLVQNGQNKANPLTTNAVDINDFRIALDTSACQEADLAILPEPNSKCQARHIFHPNSHTNYQIFIDKEILIQPEHYSFYPRPWENNILQTQLTYQHERK